MVDRWVYLVALISVADDLLTFGIADKISSSCPENARFNLTGEKPNALGIVTKSGQVFPPKSRWLQAGDTFGCSCYSQPCLPLCCSPEQIMVNAACTKTGSSDSATFPLVYKSTDLNKTDAVRANDEDFQMVVNNPCKFNNDYSLDPVMMPQETFYLLQNGSIYLPRARSRFIYDFDSYCLAVGAVHNFTTFVPRVCAPVAPKTVTHTVMGVGMIMSVPFLVATFIVYTILPELRNIHGLTLRGYVGSLAVAYAALSIAPIVNAMNKFPCLFTAYTIQFSFLASFFWLNVMCFDIWWKFGRSGLLQRSAGLSKSKRFLIYSAYAWGCAIFLTSICAIIDYAPGIPSNIIRPKFGIGRCWFNSDSTKALYLFVPMGITVVCNLVLFALTVVKITQDKKEMAQHLEGVDSKRHHDNKQLFNLYLKLFIVMGINWSMEIISWLAKGPHYLWLITDMVNMIQGVIIFIIFICKRKILRLLKKRFGCKARQSENLSSNSTRSGEPSGTSNPTGATSISLHERKTSNPASGSRNN